MFAIRSEKADRSMHRIWHENTLLKETEDYIIGANENTPVTDAENKIVQTDGLSLFYFSKIDYFNIIIVFAGEHRYYYCNLASPARWEEGVLVYTDYDLDLVVKEDFTYEVLDEAEFADNKAYYKYDDQVVEKVGAALHRLKRMIADRQAPFNDQFVQYWYDTYRHNR